MKTRDPTGKSVCVLYIYIYIQQPWPKEKMYSLLVAAREIQSAANHETPHSVYNIYIHVTYVCIRIVVLG